jgi:hypothetical protein
MKKANTIYETRDYESFKSHALNRVEEPRPELVKAMKKDGFLDAYPIHTVRKWKKYVIKAGHHRFAAARKLGIPIKFVITEEDGKLPQEYIPESRWTPKDVMVSYAKAGNKEYQYLAKYTRTYGIPIAVAIRILGKTKPEYGKTNAQGFRGGHFEVGNYHLGEKVGEIVSHCANIVPYAKSKLFAGAVTAACKIDGFDPERFMHKMTKYGHMMDKQPDISSYIAAFERIYNRGARKGTIVPISVFYRSA